MGIITDGFDLVRISFAMVSRVWVLIFGFFLGKENWEYTGIYGERFLLRVNLLRSYEGDVFM